MTRILVQRGSGSSSSNQNRSSTPTAPSSSSSNVPTQQPQGVPSASVRGEGVSEEGHEQQVVVVNDYSENKTPKSDDEGTELDQNGLDESVDGVKVRNDSSHVDLVRGFSGLSVADHAKYESGDGSNGDDVQSGTGSSQPPPPPVPPPKPSASNSNLRRFVSGASESPRIGPSRRPPGWPVSARTSPSASRPSSPRSHCESEGYNSADEQNPCFGSSFYDLERERQFEIDIRRAKGLEVKRMQEDGNCLFRAVADQVYGDSEAYDLTRQMCIDYMVSTLYLTGMVVLECHVFTSCIPQNGSILRRSPGDFLMPRVQFCTD